MTLVFAMAGLTGCIGHLAPTGENELQGGFYATAHVGAGFGDQQTTGSGTSSTTSTPKISDESYKAVAVETSVNALIGFNRFGVRPHLIAHWDVPKTLYVGYGGDLMVMFGGLTLAGGYDLIKSGPLTGNRWSAELLVPLEIEHGTTADFRCVKEKSTLHTETLPNGRERSYTTTECTEYDTSHASVTHYNAQKGLFLRFAHASLSASPADAIDGVIGVTSNAIMLGYTQLVSF